MVKTLFQLLELIVTTAVSAVSAVRSGPSDLGLEQAARHFGRGGHQGPSLWCPEDGHSARHRLGHRSLGLRIRIFFFQF